MNSKSISFIDFQSDIQFLNRQSLNRPLLLVFYDAWTGANIMMEVIAEKIAKDYPDKFLFYKVDVKKSAALLEALDLSSPPNFLIFYKEKIIDHFNQLSSKKKLLEMLNNAFDIDERSVT